MTREQEMKLNFVKEWTFIVLPGREKLMPQREIAIQALLFNLSQRPPSP
jgi:hypothetical protein